MVKIQVDLNEEENKKITIYKTLKGLETKMDALREMIREFPLNIGQLFKCMDCRHEFYSHFIWNRGKKRNITLKCPKCTSSRVSIKI